MTDAGMNEEAAIPREAAWSTAVVELVKVAREYVVAHDVEHDAYSDDAKDISTLLRAAKMREVLLEKLRAKLAPFKSVEDGR